MKPKEDIYDHVHDSGYKKVLDHGFVRVVDKMGTDLSIVQAARVSYGSDTKGPEADKKLLFFLLKNHHTSPFEMVQIKFQIQMPIFVMRQFVRHRMQSINEVSARYTELPDVFYVPEVWRAQDTKNKQGSVEATLNHKALSEILVQNGRNCYTGYQLLLQQGVAKELARLTLPVNIYTKIICNWDLNNLLKFFRLRDDPHAQWEHQQFAKAMKELTREQFPWTMEAYDEFMAPK